MFSCLFLLCFLASGPSNRRSYLSLMLDVVLFAGKLGGILKQQVAFITSSSSPATLSVSPSALSFASSLTQSAHLTPAASSTSLSSLVQSQLQHTPHTPLSPTPSVASTPPSFATPALTVPPLQTAGSGVLLGAGLLPVPLPSSVQSSVTSLSSVSVSQTPASLGLTSSGSAHTAIQSSDYLALSILACWGMKFDQTDHMFLDQCGVIHLIRRLMEMEAPPVSVRSRCCCECSDSCIFMLSMWP